MSNRPVDVLLEDTITSVNYIEQFIEGYDFQSFKADRKTLDATIRNLEVIGETAKLLPEDFKQQYPNIAWKQIIGLRNVAIHGYFRVDVTILWQIVTQDLPSLKLQIQAAMVQINNMLEDQSSS